MTVGRGPARILIVSDAWTPQVNGVVRTLAAVTTELRAMGHMVEVIGPDRFRTMPCPTYPEIGLAVLPQRRLVGLIEAFRPDALHIATEGPLGLAARAWACRRNLHFTTAYHTRFPEYLAARLGLMGRSGITRAMTSRFLKWFHAPSQGVMVSTQSMREELAMRGFVRLRAGRAASICRFSTPPCARRRPISRNCRGRSSPISGASPWKRISAHSST